MSYYDDMEKWDAVGADYDLIACLTYNPQGSFGADDIEKVVAVVEGENDGADWHWILLLNAGFRPPHPGVIQGEGDMPMIGTGKSLSAPEIGGANRKRTYVYLVGGCDYTGWDCQSSATHKFATSPEEAAEHAKPEGDSWRAEEYQIAYDSLVRQIADGKHQTWREKMDNEFGLKD